jgi:glycosyltransferase involved in cell wall biosynthesis
MGVKKKLLVLYAKNPQEVFNPQSALGSYVFCLANLLHGDEFDVYINGIAVTEVGKQSSSKSNPSKQSQSSWKKFVPNFLKSIIKDWVLFRQMDRLFRAIDENFQYDAILEMCSYGSDIGARLSKKHNVPLYTIFDSPAVEEFTYLNNYTPIFKHFINQKEKYTLASSQKIVVYSPTVKDYLQKRYKLHDKAFFYHQNVDFNRLDIIDDKPTTNDELVFGFIGSFLKWHRVDMLVEAFNKLRAQGIKAKLVLLGYGMEWHSVKALVDDSQFNEDIEMPGFVDGEGLKTYKKKTTIGLMPGSNWYGAPNKIFEYGAAKIAVISVTTPTISFLFEHEKDVLFFDENNEHQLLECMLNLANNSTAINRLSESLYQKVKSHHTPANTFNFYTELLKS